MEFSEQVMHARKKLGFSQMKFAEELCVSFSSINRWERGHTDPPQVIKNVFYEYCKKKGIDFTNLKD